MKKLLLIVMLPLLAATLTWTVSARPNSASDTPYTFAALRRGDLENLVSSTGTLNAVGTVEVGSQVSGVIDHLYADFNQRVAAGHLLAVLDTSALAASVRDAEAGVARTKAQYNQARYEYERHVPLAEKEFLSEMELRALETQVETARAVLQSAEATLQRARTNLAHTAIRAPIEGTVIQRNVEAGQTVAASLAAPILFVIAEDLAQMEILALVDESDIGQIRQDQAVRFTVQAYPEQTFKGTVRQIRLQPQTIQNVVNYTVVVDAANEQGLLLPGMTATVDFVVERVEDVLLAPAAALRFQPTPEMRAAMRAQRAGAMPDSARQQRRASAERGARRSAPAKMSRLWYLDEAGAPAMLVVRTGATDGLLTEIRPPNRPGKVPSIEIVEGLQIINGMTANSTKALASSASTRQGGKRRFGPAGLF